MAIIVLLGWWEELTKNTSADCEFWLSFWHQCNLPSYLIFSPFTVKPSSSISLHIFSPCSCIQPVCRYRQILYRSINVYLEPTIQSVHAICFFLLFCIKKRGKDKYENSGGVRIILLFVCVHVSTWNNGVCFDTLISLQSGWQFALMREKSCQHTFHAYRWEDAVDTGSEWVRFRHGERLLRATALRRDEGSLGWESKQT